MNGTKPLKKNLERGRNEGSYQASLTKHRSATIRIAFAIAFIVVISSMMATFESDKADGEDPGGECGGGLNWQYDSKNSTLKITKTDSTDFTGVMYDYTDNNPSPWIGFKKVIMKTEITGYITHIGNYAFYNLTALNDIIIKDLKGDITTPNLKSIGDHAFDGCKKLDTIEFGDTKKTIEDFSNLISIGDYAFNKCKFTGNLTIPNSVTSIGNYAFNECDFTGNLTIPNSVTNIGSHAFNECDFTGNLTIPNSVTNIGSHAFNECDFNGSLTLGSSITKVGEYAFNGCRFTSNLTIPDSVTTIGDYAFNECGFNGSLTLGSSITKMGAYAFKECKFTGDLTIPNNVETIGDHAFNECAFDGSLTLCTSAEDSKIKYIGEYAFSGCPLTGDLAIPNNVETIGDYAFNGCFTQEATDRKLTLSNNLTTIGNYAFNKCKFTGNLTIPNSVTSIGNYAFNECDFTGNLTIPNSVTIIGSHAFNECGFNGYLTLGSNITRIGGYSFCGCEFTGSLTIPNKVPIVGDHAFDGCRFDGSLTLGSSITKVGEYAFYECKFTGNLTIPNNVETIADHAFNGCFTQEGPTDWKLTLSNNLTTIGNNAFYGCKFTGNLTVPNKVTIIGDYAFHGCRFDGSLTLGSNITSIGVYAFKECKFTGNLNVPNKITTIEDHTFDGCKFTGNLTILDSVTTIGNYAFSECDFNGSLTLGSSITKVGEYAFNGCRFTSNLTIPDSVTTIGKHAYKDCKFNKLIIPSSIYNFGEYPFEGCVFSGGLEIDKDTKKIYDTEFGHATFGGRLIIPDKVQFIGSSAFEGSTFSGKSGNKHIIADSVEVIGNNAFKSCSLKNGSNGTGELQISRNLVTIGEKAFFGSDINVEELIFSPRFKTQGSNAFAKDENGLQPIIKKLVVMNIDVSKDDIKFEGYKILDDKDPAEEITDLSSDDFKKHYFEKGDVSEDDRIILNRKGDVDGNIVTYFRNGGSEPEPIGGYYYKGQDILIAKYEGTKEGYSFLGWLYNDTPIQPGITVKMGDDPIEFKALWIKKLKVIYDVNGGSTKGPETKEYARMTTVTVEGYSGTIYGYQFEGWTWDGKTYTPGESITVGDSDIVLIAKWAAVHKVTYDVDGGSGTAPSQEDVLEGATFEVKSYSGTKTGYQFDGWISDGKIYQAGDIITMDKKDVALLAVWTATHSVTYDLNGGTGTAPTQEDVAEGDTFTVKACTATMEGYSFNGWSYDRLTFFEGDIITMELDDIVLKAVWKKGQPMHHVTYDLRGGSGEAPIQADVQEGDTFTVKMYTGTKEGYTFGGWEYGIRIYEMGSTIKMGSHDIVLKAFWLSDTPGEQDGRSKIIMIAAAVIGSVAAAGIGAVLFIRKS